MQGIEHIVFCSVSPAYLYNFRLRPWLKKRRLCGEVWVWIWRWVDNHSVTWNLRDIQVSGCTIKKVFKIIVQVKSFQLRPYCLEASLQSRWNTVLNVEVNQCKLPLLDFPDCQNFDASFKIEYFVIDSVGTNLKIPPLTLTEQIKPVATENLEFEKWKWSMFRTILGIFGRSYSDAWNKAKSNFWKLL